MKKRIFEELEGWKKYVFIYAILLFASHLTTWVFDGPPVEQQGAEEYELLNIVNKDSTLSDETVKVYYRDIYTGKDANPQTLVLIPGGTEGAGVFEEITDRLSDRYRLIIPQLPGYGSFQSQLPAYSFYSLAVYTRQLLDKLELSKVNVLGFGLGGASAIYLAHDYPEKVQSLILASSIGVQELELLGSYRLNHALHGIQLGAVWLLQNAIPHFGALDLIGLNVSYAKSHYESDQRPLRSHLKEYGKPMLIVHGVEDALVPVAAAREHHRIVPQSTIKLYAADHDLLETHSDSVGEAIDRFLTDVENGRATTADEASPERIREAEAEFSNIEFQKFKGFSLLIIMVIIMLATLVSEDLTCIGAGLLAARGLIGFWPATIACLVGIFVGDVALYLAGRFLGRAAVRKAPFKWFISEQDLNRSARWFDSRGPAIIIASRFLPGSRLPTYFTAGVIGAGFWMFCIYFLLAAVVWTPLLVGISKLLGNELIRYFSLYRDYAIWVFFGAIIFLVMVVKVILPVFSYRGRRFLVSRYRRLSRWEYWSPFIIYAPVFIYVLYLGIRHRCLTLFTAVNPALPDSGFVGESKSEILDLFRERDVASYRRIRYDSEVSRMQNKAEQFMEERGLDYPVVLKPDVGERGKQVQIVRNREQMKQYIKEVNRDFIIQEYVSGEEFGVFYYRYPEEEKGNIYSITVKHLLCIEGDGRRTIEQLILDDDRAVSLAKYHLEQNRDRLYEVPDEGEKVSIVELGTHAMGSVFSDGEDLITDALTTKMDRICDAAEDYYFGRLDIKAPSAQHLKRGEELTVLEANGVSSESTNIYDSSYSFWDAQRILMKQWKLAFEIGGRNRKRGISVTPLSRFVRHLVKTLGRQ